MTYTDLFYKHIMFRHSCGKCHFTNLKRPSDITLADFWGWDKVDPEINIDDKGVSLLLINSKKGMEIFEAIKKDLHIIPVKLEDCMQPQLQEPTKIHPDRDKFEKEYIKYGFEYVFQKYKSHSSRSQYVALIKYRIRNILPNFILLFLKKVL